MPDAGSRLKPAVRLEPFAGAGWKPALPAVTHRLPLPAEAGDPSGRSPWPVVRCPAPLFSVAPLDSLDYRFIILEISNVRKSPVLDPRQRQAAARVMQALAHPVRLGVLQCLAMREHTVTELYEALGCSQSMMSQQLRLLAAQGLVEWRRAGVVKHCRLGNPAFVKLFACLENHVQRLRPAPAAARWPRPNRRQREG